MDIPCDHDVKNKDMKKLIIIVSSILLAGIVLFGLYGCFFKRTTETILKSVFGISLQNFDYTVEAFDEKWYPNGDGESLLVFKFSKLTQENIDYLKGFNPKPLPISDEVHGSIPRRFLKADTGYYLYRPTKINNLEIKGRKIESVVDFDIFIIDTERMMAVLYFTIS